MKKIIYTWIGIVSLLVCITSCKQSAKQNNQHPDNAHTSQNSLDWDGDYKGVIPCADCEGISVSLNLNLDETYQLSYLYLGESDSIPDYYNGKFTWDKSGSVIKLDVKHLPPYYKVGENHLIQLDMEGKPIDGKLADQYFLWKE